MQTKKRKLCVLLVGAILFLGGISPKVTYATAQATQTTVEGEQDKTEEENPILNVPIDTNKIQGWPQGPKILEESAILMDADTGTILYSKQIDEKRYPASTTKIMTTLLALENSNMEDIVTITETGMEAAYSGSSNIIPVLGEQFTMEQCLYMIMLKSANDVSNQVAEYVGGTLENFINMMNERARQLGCKNTNFNNPSGLPDENHYTTAYDLALIMKEALKNDEFRKIISTKRIVIPATNMTNGARTYDNHHRMILEGEYNYPGTIGGKTGYTDAARNTLVTAANRDDMTLIAVALKVNGRQCFTDTMTLMDYGFDNFKRYNLDVDTQDMTGTIVLPKTASLEDVKVEDMSDDVEDISKQYSFNGQNIGVGALTKDVAAKEEEAQKEIQRMEDEKKEQEEKALKEQAAKEAAVKRNEVLTKVIWVLCGVVGLGILLVVVLYIKAYQLRKKRIRERILRRRELQRKRELQKNRESDNNSRRRR